jgi:uncharacterized protein
MTRAQAFTDVVLALVLTVFGGLSAAAVAALFGFPILLLLALQGLLILAGLHLLLQWRRQRWRDLRLLRPSTVDLSRGVLALVVIFVANALIVAVSMRLAPGLAEGHQERLAGVAGVVLADVPFAAVALTMLLIGFYEEVLARGFLLRRCQTLLGGAWLPVLISSLLFGLGHFYQGWSGVAQTALIGIVLGFLTLRWGTLWPAIIAHAGLNTLSLAILRAADPAL